MLEPDQWSTYHRVGPNGPEPLAWEDNVLIDWKFGIHQKISSKHFYGILDRINFFDWIEKSFWSEHKVTTVKLNP